ncbi:MAG TPA: type IV pilus twitching motility protein PilT [Clostridia bacterium]|nr:type IV pilus twitching motility protein PilT [Clostridia bacterium]
MDLINELLIKAIEKSASDLHVTVGVSPMVRINGQIQPLEGYEPFRPEDTKTICMAMLGEEQKNVLEKNGQVDFSYVVPKVGRFRVNIYKQRRSFSAAIRVLVQQMPTIESLGLPEILKELTLRPRGLILLTGPTGSGKSTTLAAMVDYINSNKRCHVLTIEDPIEYLHKHKNSIVNQREIGDDTSSFSGALRSALREDPDVILVGEMRDLETIATAISAAETGHLVLSTLHTIGAAQTVDRMIDMFPPYQQQQIRVQLASVLQAVITQQLITNTTHSNRIAALEIMTVNDAIRNMIRESKCHQITSALQTGIKQGMMPMDYHLSRLVRQGSISSDEALSHCMDVDTFKRYLNI